MNRLTGTWCLGLCLLLAAGAQAQAQTQAKLFPESAVATVEAQPSIRTMETVVVSGLQPGPGLWKVTNTAGHELWVLGTLVPAPRRMEWHSREVDAVLARVDEVIWAPSLSVSADTGIFGTLALLPRALGARNNPGGLRLVDVVPATHYARWLVLKQRYMGRDSGVEKRRPMFAAMELYESALKRSGLVQGGLITPVVEHGIKGRDVRKTSPRHVLRIADPKAALAEFRASPINDLDCFDKTLRRLETDLGNMVLRANAWATGDLAALRALPYEDQGISCIDAAMQSAAMRERGGANFKAEVRRTWLEAAERSLNNNATTFAILPMREVLAVDGYLAALQARGYMVQAPE